MERKYDYWDEATRKLRLALSWEDEWEDKLRSASDVHSLTSKARNNE